MLSDEQALAAALSWRADCARLAVERAAFWMPPPPHFGPCSRRGQRSGSRSGSGDGGEVELAQLGRGLRGVELTDAGCKTLNPARPDQPGAQQPPAASMDVDGPRGADGHEHQERAPTLRGRLSAATGHVEICGIALPCGSEAGDGGGCGGGAREGAH